MAFIAPLAGAVGGGLGGVGSLIGGLFGAVGALMEASAQKKAANYQAAVAENNAKIAAENANRASQTAQEQQIQSDNEIAAFIGQQEANQSASGLSTTGRSQLLTRKSAARIGRQDAANIIAQGNQESRNFHQQGADFRNEAVQSRMAGKAAMTRGIFGAATSLIGSVQPSRSTLYKRYGKDPWAGAR